jgi:hypothetical protein
MFPLPFLKGVTTSNDKFDAIVIERHGS